MRIEDPWYSHFLGQCRRGYLDDEMYNFIVGLPTQHCGSWMPASPPESVEAAFHPEGRSTAAGYASCRNNACARLHEAWDKMARRGTTWQAQASMECEICSAERQRRNRLLAPKDPRIHKEPFLSAAYVHKNNEPKYHAMLLRAVEDAKRREQDPRHILWVTAHDTILNPKEIGRTAEHRRRKRERFLQFHDQKTGGIPGLTPLFQARCRGNRTQHFDGDS